MTEQPAKATDHPGVDRERDPTNNPFDHDEGLFGQSYSREREQEMGRQRPSGHPLVGDPGRPPQPDADGGANIPPDNGTRGSFDPRTGEVRGSGAGAGGGNAGEDFDTATSGGAPEDGAVAAGSDRRG